MKSILEVAKRVIDIELAGIQKFQNSINTEFEGAVGEIYSCTGKVVVTGIGKSGIVGKKISATLASTGTASVFLHSAEAIHGDLGIIKKEDVVLAISYSGETDEVLRLIPSLKNIGVKTIALTGSTTSTLARYSDYVIGIAVDTEACPLKLAPTASTTVTLVAGDAIAVSLMELKRFREEDFAIFHPGGSLGRRLLRSVGDEMISELLPTIKPNDELLEVIFSISRGMLGLTVVNNEVGDVQGLITDGDLRRAMERDLSSLLQLKAYQIMKSDPIIVDKDMRIIEAEMLMKDKNVNSLIVCENKKLVGVLNQRKIKYN